MGLFDQFPYTNFHELNLMWILEALKEIKTTTEQFVAINSLKYANPIQWNIVSQYEKNTIVIDPLTGTAYISVQPVPSGVALTNTDYWTVVFDLGSFVTRAAKNFTSRWEDATTLTATFPTAAGEWLVWGDTLYVALVNITAGDQYVVNSNIKRITIEEVKNDIYTIMGDLNDLNTTDKSNLVAAINEVLTTLINTSGNLADLDTTDKSNLVAAINENFDNIDKLQFVQLRNGLPIFPIIYIDGINGNDNNDGLTIETPIKTLEYGFSLLKSNGRGIEYCFMNDHAETLSDNVRFFQNCHITLDVTTYNVDVNLTFTHNIVIYNSYFNPQGIADHIITLNFTNGLRADHSTLYFEHCNITHTETLRSVMQGGIYFNGCTINGDVESNWCVLSSTTINGSYRIIDGMLRVEEQCYISGMLRGYNAQIQFSTNYTRVGGINLSTAILLLRNTNAIIAFTESAYVHEQTTNAITLWGSAIIARDRIIIEATAEYTNKMTNGMFIRGGLVIATSIDGFSNISNTSFDHDGTELYFPKGSEVRFLNGPYAFQRYYNNTWSIPNGLVMYRSGKLKRYDETSSSWIDITTNDLGAI